MTSPFSRGLLDGLPSLLDERGLEAVRISDEALEIGLKVQQHELGIQFEAERVAEGGFDGEATKIVGCAPETPQHGRVGSVDPRSPRFFLSHRTRGSRARIVTS